MSIVASCEYVTYVYQTYKPTQQRIIQTKSTALIPPQYRKQRRQNKQNTRTSPIPTNTNINLSYPIPTYSSSSSLHLQLSKSNQIDTTRLSSASANNPHQLGSSEGTFPSASSRPLVHETEQLLLPPPLSVRREKTLRWLGF